MGVLILDKEEYLRRIDELGLDKNKYCIISGGVMLMHGLKDTTDDIDFYVLPSYFLELKERFNFKKSSKFSYLYELDDNIEVGVVEFSDKDVEYVDGYPVLSLELELEWKIKNNREKDKEAIIKIKEYLDNRCKV